MVVSIPLSRARAVYGEYSEPITHTHMHRRHRAYCQLTARIVHYCDEIEGVRVLLCHRGAYHGRSMTPGLFHGPYHAQTGYQHRYKGWWCDFGITLF